MDIQALLDKAKQGSPLTLEGQQVLLGEFNNKLLSLKEKDPGKYLQYLKDLNEILGELKQSLKNAAI